MNSICAIYSRLILNLCLFIYPEPNFYIKMSYLQETHLFACQILYFFEDLSELLLPKSPIKTKNILLFTYGLFTSTKIDILI